MKKYLEKRWVTNNLSVDTPPKKTYRKQENWVIQNINSGKLVLPSKVAQFSAPDHLTRPYLDQSSLIKWAARPEANAHRSIESFVEPQGSSKIGESQGGEAQTSCRTARLPPQSLGIFVSDEFDNFRDIYEDKSERKSVYDKYDLLPDANCSGLRVYDTVGTVGEKPCSRPVSRETEKDEWENTSLLVVCDMGVQTE